MRLCSGKQWLSNSHLALCSHRAKEGLGCLWLRGLCCLAGGIRGLKPIPKVFSLVEKADLAAKGMVCTGPSHPPFASWGGTQIGPISDTAQTVLREDAFCEPKLCSGNQPQPRCGIAQESNGHLILI